MSNIIISAFKTYTISTERIIIHYVDPPDYISYKRNYIICYINIVARRVVEKRVILRI